MEGAGTRRYKAPPRLFASPASHKVLRASPASHEALSASPASYEALSASPTSPTSHAVLCTAKTPLTSSVFKKAVP